VAVQASSDELSKLMWDQLVAVLQAEMTPTGRLSTVQDLRRGIQLWRDVSPAIGVQHYSYTEKPYATHKHQVANNFQIACACASVPTVVNGSVTKIANLDDANAQLDLLLSDGSGNGVGPVLRSTVNNGLFDPTLNGKLGLRSEITSLQRSWDIRAGSDDNERVWAYGLYTYTVYTYVII
jgi:hypothetical protein